MSAQLRIRAEAVLAAVTGVLAVVTIFWRDWIEVVFGFDPDHHDGSAEGLIVVGLAVLAVAMAALARWERQRDVRLRTT